MPPKVLVVGSGVIGLRTALELLRKKLRVCLISPHPPLHPSTCSVGAGGLWMPFHCDDDRTDRWSHETLDELMKLAGLEKSTSGDSPLVEILPAVSFKKHDRLKLPEWAVKTKSKLGFQYITIDVLYERSKQQQFRLPKRETVEGAGYSHAWIFNAPVVNSPKMLAHMLDEVRSNQYTDLVNVETGNYFTNVKEMIDEAKKLGCNAIVNSTGLGSKVLCDDSLLVGARGVLLQFDRNSCKWSVENKDAEVKDSIIMIECPPFGSETKPCYMIPRGNIIAVGGTYLEGDAECKVRQQEREEIMENAHVMGIDTEHSKPVGEWVGFRPCRPSVKLELDEKVGVSGDVQLLHNFGHGGSGWTVFIGVARDAASLVSSKL